MLFRNICSEFVNDWCFNSQFVNKLRYAKEGAKDIVDRTCSDLPWQVRLEVDGNNIEIPEVKVSNLCYICAYACTFVISLSLYVCVSLSSLFSSHPNPLFYQDAEGVIVLNIGSYMGGVDLWQNENVYDEDFDLQSMHDKALEVVCISGTWHLGKLQVCYLQLALHFFLWGNILVFLFNSWFLEPTVKKVGSLEFF